MEGQVTDFPRSKISATEFFSVSLAGEAGWRHDNRRAGAPSSPDMQTPLPRRVLRLYEFGVAPREKGTHMRRIPRVPRACPIIAHSSTRQAVTLAWRDGTRLDDGAGVRCF